MRFIGTLNNPDTTVMESYLEQWVTRHGAVYCCGQLEKGKEGTVHLQFAIAFPKPGKRITSLKKFCSRAHFEPVKLDNGIDAYCMKEDTRMEGPWEFGVRPVQRNSKTDWARCFKAAAEDRLDEIPDDIKFKHYKTIKAIQKDHMPTPKRRLDNPKKIAWLWGEARSGKSTTAREGDYYLKLGNKWWDGYKGEKRVVIDDLGKETAKALTDKIKLWADPHFDQVGETKGGAVLLTYDELIVTANWHPYDVWGQTDDYEPIKMRFKPGDKMERPKDEEKDDQEKINASDVRNWSNGF